VRAQPWRKLVEVELLCCVERDHKVVCLLGVRSAPGAVDREKRVSGSKGRALFAVDEWVVWDTLSQRAALPETRISHAG
jgi:hypothetical protein